MATCVSEKTKRNLEDEKIWKIILCIHCSDQQREKEQDDEQWEKQIDREHDKIAL